MDGREKRKSQKPLLYIVQPALKEPGFRMQSQYSSSADQPDVSREVVGTGSDARTKAKRRKTYFTEEEEFIFEDKTPEVQHSEKGIPVSAAEYFKFHGRQNMPSKSGLKPVKSFTSMTIEEKINHLSSNTQFYSCTFSTAGRKIIGKLQEIAEDSIIIKADSGDHIMIDKKDLIGIRINA